MTASSSATSMTSTQVLQPPLHVLEYNCTHTDARIIGTQVQILTHLSVSGSTSSFYFVSAPLGSLTHLRLTHDSSGFSPAWLVKQVEKKKTIYVLVLV